MPTAPYPDIYPKRRVVHVRYGRGVVAGVHRAECQAGVRFDDDVEIIKNPPPRTVWLKDLQPEPVAVVAAPCRVVWPLNRAGEAVS